MKLKKKLRLLPGKPWNRICHGEEISGRGGDSGPGGQQEGDSRESGDTGQRELSGRKSGRDLAGSFQFGICQRVIRKDPREVWADRHPRK